MQRNAQAERNVFPWQLVEQIAHAQAQIDITGQRQSTLEEQRVGIFQATGQQQQISQRSAHTGLGGGDRIEHHQPLRQHLDHKACAQIEHFDADAPALDVT